jgi:hypothetical protein
MSSRAAVPYVTFNHGVLGSSPSRLTNPKRPGSRPASTTGGPAANSIATTPVKGKKKPQARPGDEMRAWGSGRRCHSSPPHSVFRRDRSGRTALGSLGGGFRRPNAALAATIGPQVRKAALSRCGSREVHRPSAVRARRPDLVWSPTGRFNSGNANMVPRCGAFQTNDWNSNARLRRRRAGNKEFL